MRRCNLVQRLATSLRSHEDKEALTPSSRAATSEQANIASILKVLLRLRVSAYSVQTKLSGKDRDISVLEHQLEYKDQQVTTKR